jgi:branched-chain amino acid transport system substrate-binding protein
MTLATTTAAAALVAFAGSVATAAEFTNSKIKIGVVSDQSSLYADVGGPGSAVAARLALEDFGGSVDGTPVEIVSADHQNKPDVGSNVARQYYDVDQVDVIVDVPNSAVALAINGVTREKNKVFLNSGAATSALTGEQCSPNTVHWTYDTVALANGTGRRADQGRRATAGTSSPPTTPSATRWSATPRPSSARTAARSWAGCATR